jgi:hypothetical protein
MQALNRPKPTPQYCLFFSDLKPVFRLVLLALFGRGKKSMKNMASTALGLHDNAMNSFSGLMSYKGVSL